MSAGSSIYKLAWNRRVQALKHLAIAFSSFLSVLFFVFYDQLPLLSFLPGWSRVLVLLCCLGISYFQFDKFKKMWSRASHAIQGAHGEEVVAKTLFPLLQKGWNFEYNVPLGNRLGDADIYGVSPSGKKLVIDVKSHKGTLVVTNNKLFREYWQQGGVKKRYSFEKDFIGSVKRQAIQIGKQKRVQGVIPILCFPNARIESLISISGVKILDCDALILYLQSIQNR